METEWVLVLGVIAGIFILIFFFWIVPVRLWISALAAGVRVSILSLIGMRLRKVRPEIIVPSLIMAHKAGLPLKMDALEAHYLAGGDVFKVVRSLIAADKANIELSFEKACAIDLAGREVLEAVHTSVNPKVINVPEKENATIDSVARDGIQLLARARVTVRTNIERLVGGATEQTIIARVGEGIVSTIGSAETYKEVLQNPDLISKTVLSKGLDSGTSFEILSIDIVDVNVGKNVGAELQTNQAAADLKIAQARAETRRAMAVAQEQEMKAKTQEMRAKVVEAEAEVPKGIAQAFREGKLGVMDYYSLRNIQADTTMREKIVGGGEEKKDKE
ncbi:MAG: flotillin-like protein FloA [Candidatus Omnitrophica bacterium]|nr:flotillin-like protein FloA [Candidatus Omnitrophota bacterium]MBI3009062.1 flotillin-like protein FloA [Candidatus Omnitrophota bacterium]